MKTIATILISILITLILCLNLFQLKKTSTNITKRYKVYYEYNICNKDTIGVDTIYQLINTKP